jgi:hypothetical protein
MTIPTSTPKRETYHLYCLEMEITESMLDKLIIGEAYCRLCYSSKEDSERASYQLTGWQRQLFEEAKQTGILINPTHEMYLTDALHNAWESYCSIHRRPLVEVRIEPGLNSSGPLGWQWRTVYTVRFSPPNLGWDVQAPGIDELRLLITLFTDDDPTNDGWEPDEWHRSYIRAEGDGQLVDIQSTDAMPVARQALTILEQFAREAHPRQPSHFRKGRGRWLKTARLSGRMPPGTRGMAVSKSAPVAETATCIASRSSMVATPTT